MNTKLNAYCICLLLLLTSRVMARQEGSKQMLCPQVKIEVERLPDLNIPRAGHQVFCVNGEFTVAGGHTKAFVPTPTAEYFKDGQWHEIPMVYNHDVGFSVVLKSGKVLLAGGCSEPIGIGQTYLAEMYDPVTHSFDGFGCLDQKRTMASGLELDSGQVVIAGNWYHDDGIELFDGKRNCHYIKDVSVGHSVPFVFRTAKDDAIVMGSLGVRGDTLHTAIADRLKGEAVEIPLFNTWRPITATTHRDAECFIGDESKDIYAYLMAVCDSTGQIAIAKVVNGEVSLLPTTVPVPMKSQWGGIEYYSGIIADRERGRAYLIGGNADFRSQPEKGVRYYVLRIDYALAGAGRLAPLTLYYTDYLPMGNDYTPILTPKGNLLVAGGLSTALSNFYPSDHAYVLCVNQQEVPAESRSSLWWWVSGLLTALVAIVVVVLLWWRKRNQTSVAPIADNVSDEAAEALMARINDLVESERLYLNSELKVSDIASVFHVHRNDISACINSQTGRTFAQYLNRYRIDYAKQLMLNNPDKKVSSIWMESGFGSEQTFFKAFRAVMGMSPREWISQTND